ncbi:UNVERIFIED_CONTAM: hypothetical protein Scaly_2644900 [Sesamum calycinum]|uniref:RNase H type-1 domain-containing protein n=1 Tax=Sesamum calycinum TaxID=2727403 RepID=A0AAW2J9I6_9LAMI
MVTRRGIEVKPLKIKIILDMKAPTNVNGVQRNTHGGCLQVEKWLHVDGSSTTQDSGADIVITLLYGEDLEFFKFGFTASKNEVECETLVIDMRTSHDLGAKYLVAYLDSQLIVKQVEDTYKAKEENMIHYLQQIAELKHDSEVSK